MDILNLYLTNVLPSGKKIKFTYFLSNSCQMAAYQCKDAKVESSVIINEKLPNMYPIVI